MDFFVSARSDGLIDPRGVAFGPDGNLYVASFNTNEVLQYNGTTGSFLGVFVKAGSDGLSLPRDLVFGPDDNLYVSSFGSGDVFRYNGMTGAFIIDFVPSGTGGSVDRRSSCLGASKLGSGALDAWLSRVGAGRTRRVRFTQSDGSGDGGGKRHEGQFEWRSLGPGRKTDEGELRVKRVAFYQ